MGIQNMRFMHIIILGGVVCSLCFSCNQADNSLVLWRKNGMSANIYYNAAKDYLLEIEPTLQSLGNVVGVLGAPSRIENGGYIFDETDSICPNEERLTLFYDKKKVAIEFSTNGYISGILTCVTSNRMDGISIKHPLVIDDSTLLIIPPNIASDVVLELCNAVKKWGTSLSLNDWEILAVKGCIAENKIHSKVKVRNKPVIVDKVSANLFRVHVYIQGGKKYWIDTWWKYVEKGDLLRIEECEALKMIVKKKEKTGI